MGGDAVAVVEHEADFDGFVWERRGEAGPGERDYAWVGEVLVCGGHDVHVPGWGG